MSSDHSGRNARIDNLNEYRLRQRPNVQPMLTLDEAWKLVAAKLTELQDRQLSCDLPPLTDLTDGERRMEILARLNLLAADGASVDLLAAVGAHVVSWLRAVDAREQTDPTSGAAA